MSAVFHSHPQRRFCCTGSSVVPCFFGAITSSPHTMGSFTPSGTGAPLHPSESPSGTPDARVATEPRDEPAPILCAARWVTGTPEWERKAKALMGKPRA